MRFSPYTLGNLIHRTRLKLAASMLHFQEYGDFADYLGPRWHFYMGDIIASIPVPWKFAESVFQKCKGFCFLAKGPMARHNEGASPKWGCDRGATMPEGVWRENPSGGSAFGRNRRWLVTQSPLRGFSCLAASAAAKIPRRRIPCIFKARS
jgi:hypothetical protein